MGMDAQELTRAYEYAFTQLSSRGLPREVFLDLAMIQALPLAMEINRATAARMDYDSVGKIAREIAKGLLKARTD